MKVLIIGSGNAPHKDLLKMRYEWADLVIAADGGGAYLTQNNYKPHILLGDFDSIKDESLIELRAQSDIEIFSFPVHKDFTDMELAINLAIERGAKEVVLLGASGTRLDHTMANVFLLDILLKEGIKACLQDNHNQVYLIGGVDFAPINELTIKKQGIQKVSLLPITSCVEGVNTKGLSYPLCEATLYFGSSLSVSNEFFDDTAVISLKKGSLLVILSKD